MENRESSSQDAEKLRETFRRIGFRVEVVKDVTHYDIIPLIEKWVEIAKDYSTLFVCILSHGVKGHIFGVNSIRVSVEEIKTALYAFSKPKVLILQSCQGTECQKGKKY